MKNLNKNASEKVLHFPNVGNLLQFCGCFRSGQGFSIHTGCQKRQAILNLYFRYRGSKKTRDSKSLLIKISNSMFFCSSFFGLTKACSKVGNNKKKWIFFLLLSCVSDTILRVAWFYRLKYRSSIEVYQHRLFSDVEKKVEGN